MKIFFSQILFLLLGTAVMGDNFFQFGPCNISININEIWDSFAAVKEFVVSIVSCAFLYETHPSSDRCCLIHRVLRFYLDRVFRHCETENLHINRKISGIANSFLSIVKKFRECVSYFTMDVSSAAMKSLGELDILIVATNILCFTEV
uniref:Interleukin 19 n=1 Tax=Salvator merianae TaxID=96440 RepID=A0A8D0BWU2_SALMN